MNFTFLNCKEWTWVNSNLNFSVNFLWKKKIGPSLEKSTKSHGKGKFMQRTYSNHCLSREAPPSGRSRELQIVADGDYVFFVWLDGSEAQEHDAVT